MGFKKRDLAVICSAGLVGVVSAVAVAGGATLLEKGQANGCLRCSQPEVRSVYMDGPVSIAPPIVIPAIPEKEEAAVEQEPMCIVEAEPYNPYANLDLTDRDKELLARMAYTEARGEPFEGQVAVVQVALNRVLFDGFGDTVEEVLLAPNQFVVGKKYGDEQMEAVEAALAGHDVLGLDTSVVYFSTGKLKCGSYFATIGGHVFRTAS